MTRIAIFLPNWIGDVCMATPTIRSIAHHYRQKGDCHIVGIMQPYVAHVLEGTSWIDESWFWRKHSANPAQGQRALVARLRADTTHVAVLMPNSLRTALIAWLGGARRRIGYADVVRRRLLTDAIPPVNRSDRDPLVFRLLRLAEAMGCTQLDPQLELATTERDEISADGVWKALGLRYGAHVITFNCGSAKSPSRRWPLSRFGALARRIAERLGYDILVMCGPGEESIARQVVDNAAHPRVVSMAGQPLDLGTAKACIRRASMMVSTDSGPRHVAVALNRPVVTLHGPVSPRESANPTARATDVMLDLPCVDCRCLECPLGHHRCMQDLTVDAVFDKVIETLKRDMHRVAA